MDDKEAGPTELSGIVYMTTCLMNGKIYVGIHTKGQCWYLGSGKIIKRAIEKYGRENFTRKTIDEFSSIEEGCSKERWWIEKLNSKSPHGYNLNGGGEGQFNPSPETREKLSVWQKGHGADWRRHTPESRAKISIYRRGRKLSDKTKEKISISKKGCSFSLEQRAKWSEIKKGKPWTKARRDAQTRRSAALQFKKEAEK